MIRRGYPRANQRDGRADRVDWRPHASKPGCVLILKPPRHPCAARRDALRWRCLKRSLRKLWTQLGIPADFARRAEKRLQSEALRLVGIGRATDDGRILRVTPATARSWRKMQAAAQADGVMLLPLSAFRSVARQALIIRRKLARGDRLEDILRVNAAPGCSEHHTGRALDFGAPGHWKLEASFARTREFRWLRRHAGGFGFRLSYPRGNRQGIAYEPWHWCWHAKSRRSARAV